MTRLRVVIVDDEPTAREGLQAMLSDLPDVDVVGEAGTGRAAVELIRSARPDLVFLDIRIPDLDGFRILEELPEEDQPAVIFATAYDEHAAHAFETRALDYLVKPFGDRRLREAVERARERLRTGRASDLQDALRALLADRGDSYPKRLTVKTGKRISVVPLDQVDWIEGAGDYARIRSGGKTHLMSERLKTLEDVLDPERFVRIHRSCIVNVDRIRQLVHVSHGDYEAVLQDGTRLRVSRTRREELERVLGSLD